MLGDVERHADGQLVLVAEIVPRQPAAVARRLADLGERELFQPLDRDDLCGRRKQLALGLFPPLDMRRGFSHARQG